MTGKEKARLNSGDVLTHPRHGKFIVMSSNDQGITVIQTKVITDVDLEEWSVGPIHDKPKSGLPPVMTQDRLDNDFEEACRTGSLQRTAYQSWLVSFPSAPSVADFKKKYEGEAFPV